MAKRYFLFYGVMLWTFLDLRKLYIFAKKYIFICYEVIILDFYCYNWNVIQCIKNFQENTTVSNVSQCLAPYQEL